MSSRPRRARQDTRKAAFVYRILLAEEWRALQKHGEFGGNDLDQRDGYIHLSAREQITTTLEAHFDDVDDVVVVEIDAQKIAADLRWETSRDDRLFPHLYGKLPLSAVVRVLDLD